MWLLEGRYSEDDRQELSKLLKYGETYTIGRKIPADILIDSKFVSRTFGHITVGEAPLYPADLDPAELHTNEALRPKVTIRFEPNRFDKSYTVLQAPRSGARDAQPFEIKVPPDQDFVLRDQDSVVLSATITLRLVWRPLAVCSTWGMKEAALSPLRSSAAKLGLFLSPVKAKWRDGFTHLCVVTLKPSQSVMEALIQVKPIVTLQYVAELIRLGNLPRHDPDSLETNFPELDPAAYQPQIDHDAFSEMTDVPSKIQPNVKRSYMLQGTTCVFFALPSDNKEVSVYKDILARAGACVHEHDPEKELLSTKSDFAQMLMPLKNIALTFWRNSGAKPRSEAPDEGLVVLCNSEHNAAEWKTALTYTCSKLRIAMAGFHSVSHAIFAADVRAHFNFIPANPELELESGSSPPPSSPVAEETTRIEESASPRNGDRQASNGGSTGRSQVNESVEMPAVLAQETAPTDPAAIRRPLKRRTQRVTADEDVQAMAVDRPETQAPAAMSSQVDLAAGTRPQSRLTRRTGTDRQASRRSDVFDALLRSNNGEGSHSGSRDELGSSVVNLDSASSNAFPRSRQYRLQLDEEDRAEEQLQSQLAGVSSASEQSSATAGQKRKQPSADAPTDDADRAKRARRAPTPELELPSQSQVIVDDDVQEPPAGGQVIRREASSVAGLASGAEPDTEPQFLQALNTQRAKGKRMDAFDAEFNNLRIARPNQLNDREAARHSSNFLPTGQARRQQEQSQAAQRPPDEHFEAFKKMAQEELRIHVRGNFVQVDFVPLIYRKEPTAAPRAAAPNGAPNFKKFRPKGKASQTQIAQNGSPTKPAVSLMLTKTNDYGLGDAYWKDKSSATVLDDGEGPSRGQNGGRSRVPSGHQNQRRSSIVNLDLSDGSDGEDPHFTPTRARGRNARHSPIAVEDSEVDELQSSAGINLNLDDSIDELEDADMTMLQRRQKANTRTRAPTRKPPPRQARGAKRVVAESDDDEDGPVKSKKPALELDSDDFEDDNDDDDDDIDNGNFAGFGKSTSTRSSRRAPAPRGKTARGGRSAF